MSQELTTWINSQTSGETENYARKLSGKPGEHPEDCAGLLTVPPSKARIFDQKKKCLESPHKSHNRWYKKGPNIRQTNMQGM